VLGVLRTGANHLGREVLDDLQLAGAYDVPRTGLGGRVWRVALDESPRQLFALRGLELDVVTGVVISSVVPNLNSALIEASRRYLKQEPLMVGPGVKTSVRVRYDNPKEVGSDRIMNALAAVHLYGGPAIVVDFGTSTNFDVVSARGEFLGGALAPGIEISVDALAARAAQLVKVQLVRPRSVIGKSTVEALQSGLLFGFAGQVDGLVQRIAAELAPGAETDVVVVATGGLAPLLIAESRTITHHAPHLTLLGLKMIFKRNIS